MATLIKYFEGLTLSQQRSLLSQLSEIHRQGKTIYVIETERIVTEEHYVLKLKQWQKAIREWAWERAHPENQKKKQHLQATRPTYPHNWHHNIIVSPKYYDSANLTVTGYDAGLIWIILRGVISEFFRSEYPFTAFRIEETSGSGFRKSTSRANPCKMTDFMLKLGSVCKSWRSVLKAKCVWFGSEWAFRRGTIDPPHSRRICAMREQPHMQHVQWHLITIPRTQVDTRRGTSVSRQVEYRD